MITFYFDTNLRTLIQSPGDQAPASPQTWVYGDNYNLRVYVVQTGQYLPILASDTLTAMLYQPQPSLPEQQLAIIGTPSILADANGNKYFSLNVNLATTQLAALVQASNKAAICQFHFVFNPTDLERFSESQDVQTTINPDPTQGATGGTPAPPGYPSNPNVFEQVANKNAVGGYVGLDANAHLNPAQIPTDTSLHVVSGTLSVVVAGGGGNPYVAVISGSFTIPAENATVAVTLVTAVPDLVATQGLLITDGVSALNTVIVSVSGTALTLRNAGGGAVSGTMAANSHVYMGNRAGLADANVSGLVPALPATTPTKEFFRGDGAYQPANYPDLTNIPAIFAPSPHANAHLTTGGDPIALATISAAGLCPPPDNSTIIISGGKLTSIVSGGAGNPYVATIPATFTIPAANATAAVTLGAATPDLTLGAGILVVDTTHVLNGIVSAISGTALTIRNTGSTGGAVTGTMGAGSHVYLGNNADLASTVTPGISRPDGTSIIISNGVLSNSAAPVGQHGTRRRNASAVNTLALGSLTVIQFDTIYGVDNDGYYTNSPPGTFTIPAGQAGWYTLGCCIAWPTIANVNFLTAAIYLNGLATLLAMDQRVPLTVVGFQSDYAIQNVSSIYQLAVGNTITFLGGFGVSSGTPAPVLPAGNFPHCWILRIS